MKFICLIFSLVFLASAADDPAFEVASIKPNKAQSGSSGTHTTNSRLTTENVNLRRLILMAYDLRESQLTGGPAWIDDVGWDIAAKAEKELPKGREGEQVMRAMLRSLLAERFQLRLHKETKELSVYALMVAKNGAKRNSSGGSEVVFEKSLKNLHFGPGPVAQNLAVWIFEGFGQQESFKSVAREGPATSGP
jgi:uncharacterized protein (TIGR03435 family)